MKNFKFSTFSIIWLLLLVFMLGKDLFFDFATKKVDVSELISMLDSNKVNSIEFNGDDITIQDKEKNKYRSVMPRQLQNNFYEDYLKEKVNSKELVFTAVADRGESIIVKILPYIIILVMFMFMTNTMLRGAANQNKEMSNFSKSRAKLFDQSSGKKITFKDVAGLKEEKKELYEIVDFLKSPKKYVDIGARVPKGVLLVGPPGTGKTYISKAVAGEAGVPFFSISGSEFLEMFVGVGASRVRDLFNLAKKNSPCIIFIDEIDAVGRKRGSGLGGGHDEREQTLNQLLVEMDGFDKNEGIIIMAATNRPDILDDALLRPGRFDRKVVIGLPDVRGREEILKIHTEDKPLASDIDLEHIARRTPGFSPADLENLVNEGAILSARAGFKEITKPALEEASIKVLAGPEKTSTLITEKEKTLVSFHESGHAIVGRSIEGYDPVHMVTIVPRGSAGGFTYTVSEEEKYYYTKGAMLDEITVLLAGRVAEELMLDDVSTGAANDIDRATKIAHDMVSKYGMAESIGTLNFTDDGSNLFIGNAITHSKTYSEETLKNIDSEMKKIVDSCYDRAKSILKENEDKLRRLASVLMEKETVYKNEFEAIYNGDYDGKKFEDEKINIF